MAYSPGHSQSTEVVLQVRYMYCLSTETSQGPRLYYSLAEGLGPGLSFLQSIKQASSARGESRCGNRASCLFSQAANPTVRASPHGLI